LYFYIYHYYYFDLFITYLALYQLELTLMYSWPFYVYSLLRDLGCGGHRVSALTWSGFDLTTYLLIFLLYERYVLFGIMIRLLFFLVYLFIHFYLVILVVCAIIVIYLLVYLPRLLQIVWGLGQFLNCY